jgi:uncharacterized protein with ParB-like and HNH nuclease domain
MQIGILPPELKSIEQLFAGDVRFSVPRYQRSFAWTSDETEELWDDLFGAANRSGEYFLGTVVLHRRDSNILGIIDGQQRLACITMLFSAIRNVFLATKDDRAIRIEAGFLGSKDFGRASSLTPKLTLNKINNETFVQYILTSPDLASIEPAIKLKNTHQSDRLLLDAYKTFLTKVSNEVAARGTKADEFLVSLIDTLRNKVKLITIPVTSDEDANLFFESLNARGKELAISDLVKNRLYLEAANDVDRVEQLWEKMEKDLDKRPIPEFIRHYWIAKKREKDSPNVREKNLYRMVSNEIKNNQNEAVALAIDLGVSALDYARISDYSSWPDDNAYGSSFEESLKDLRLFRITQMNPVLLNAIQNFSSAADIAKTFRIVANFAFRYFIIGNQSTGNVEKVAANIAFEIRDKTYTSPSHIADALRGINSDPTFRSDFNLASIEGKRMGRYILSRITNHMAKQATPTGGEQIANPDAREVNLEHVYPESRPASWNGDFSKGINPADYVYRIGNLTLLLAKPNRNAADKSFADKKTIALNASNLKVNDFFRPLSKWGDKEIDQRQDGFAKAALEVWKL